MSTKRTEIIEDYFRIMDDMRRLKMGPHKLWTEKLTTVTRAQLGVLMLVQRHNLNTVKALAEHLGISASAATQIVDGLVKAKFLTRTTAKDDRRKAILALSKRGLVLFTKMKQGMRKSFTELLEPLSDAELKLLVKLQQKIVDHFKQVK